MVLARVEVEEFERFWSVFSTLGAERRAEHGCRGAEVFRSEDDPHVVWIQFDWDSRSAEEFFADPKADALIRASGAKGMPELHFAQPWHKLPA